MHKIISVGKKHEAMYEQAIIHFEKRTAPFSKIEWVLIPHSSLDNIQARTEESKLILNKLNPSDVVVLLDETGTLMSSPQFAQIIEQSQNHSKHITYILGGAYGVTDELKSRADFVVSFGKMVLPHQLMRVVLLEQIYRAHSILSGSGYHHI
jgi:23S rRNA (pseudouridine1915-N3)-methyltransferase